MRFQILILIVGLLFTRGNAGAQDMVVNDTLIADTLAIDTSGYEMPQQRSFNALRYSLDNHHQYKGDRLQKPLSFIALGGGRMTINDSYLLDPSPLFLVHLRFGRQLNTVSSLRAGINGGIGMVNRKSTGMFYNSINGHVELEADYLYSFTSHVMGYRPERRFDLSGFVGIGAGYSQLYKSMQEDWEAVMDKRKVTAFLKGGMQLKIFAGAQAALAIEPYVYAATKGLDLVKPEHEIYTYRMGMGLDISFIQYLGNQLTEEQNAGSFKRAFSRQQRYFASDVPKALLAHPIIAGLQTGMAGASGQEHDLKASAGIGHTAYLGWWLSPAIGIRGSIGTENMMWKDYDFSPVKHYIAYRHGAMDLMINPLGFGKHYDWQSPLGVSILLGYETGWAAKEDGINGFPAFGYRGGLNLWVRLTDGVRLTVEPQYSTLIHKNEKLLAAPNYLARMKVGLEMMIGGNRHSDDEKNTWSYPLGYFIGAGGGKSFTPQYYEENAKDGGWLNNGLILAGYEYDRLNGIRLSAEYMKDVFYQNGKRDAQQRWVATIGYRLALSNLLRNINSYSRWNVSANIGPALAFGGEKTALGANAGLQLDYRLGKHFSLFLAQNLYWMPGGLYDTDQTTETNLTSTYNLGVMYHFENLVEPTLQVIRTTGKAVGTAGEAVGLAASATGRAIGLAASAVGRHIGEAGNFIAQGVSHVAKGMTDQDGHPLFIDYALGYQYVTDLPTKGIDVWEPEIQFGLGWWALPSLGLRAGFDFIRSTSEEKVIYLSGHQFTRYDKMRLSYLYADLLINPLGFSPKYNWKSKFGVNLIAGRTLLNLGQDNIEKDYWKNGWRLGAQLWTMVTPGMRLHVEPMISLIDCEPQSSKPDAYTSLGNREVLSLKVGVSMIMHDFREKTAEEDKANDNKPSKWFAALGGGLHFNKDHYRYKGGNTNSNIQLFGGYKIWSNTAIRLGAELTFDYFLNGCTYTLKSGPKAGQALSGNGFTTFRYLFTSLAYQYDLAGLLNDSDSRRWEFNVFGGMGLSSYLNESTTIPYEQEDYEVPAGDHMNPLNLSMVAGAMVNYKISRNWGIYFNHNFYLYSLGKQQWLQYSEQAVKELGNINTFNIGLMYHF